MRGTLLASGVMAFAGLGDAVLYPVLPIHAEDLGIPALWIGVLLSVNRFVRVLSNTWVANRILALGMKRVLIITSFLAVVTTLIYGLGLGLICFLVARILWGISYSGMKTATLNYAAQNQKSSGLAFGLSQGIKSLGALMAFLLGPLLIHFVGVSNGLIVIALMSVLAIVFAYQLQHVPFDSGKVRTKKTFSPTPVNLLVFGLSIAIDGILVVVLAHLLEGYVSNTSDKLMMVASYLLLSRLFMVFISFLSGIVSLRLSAIAVFNASVLFCLLGLSLIAWGQVSLGIVVVFLFNAVVVSFSPLIAISFDPVNHLQALSGVSTWWDFGAGLGALIGIVLIEFMGQHTLFLIVSLVIALLFFNFIIRYAKANGQLISTSFSIYQKKNFKSTGC